jgi:hypothetical protein
MEVYLHVFLTTALHAVIDVLHGQAALPSKRKPRYPFHSNLSAHRSRSGRSERKTLALAGNLLILEPLFRGLVTIPTALSRLPPHWYYIHYYIVTDFLKASLGVLAPALCKNSGCVILADVQIVTTQLHGSTIQWRSILGGLRLKYRLLLLGDRAVNILSNNTRGVRRLGRCSTVILEKRDLVRLL